MNELAVFDYNETAVRVINVNGEPWWVLKDVCNVLNIENARDVAAHQFDADEVGKTYAGVQTGNKRDGSPAMQQKEVYIINESGLYSLIIRSNKPEAKVFRRWVTHEVLPSIRKTGAYGQERLTFEQRIKAVGEISKCSRYNLPYAAAILKQYMPDVVVENFKPKPKESSVELFLAYYGVIADYMPTNTLYKVYQEYCLLNKLQPTNQINFSKAVKSLAGINIISKKINGSTRRVFVR